MKRLWCLFGHHDRVWHSPINWKNGEYWTCTRCPKVGK